MQEEHNDLPREEQRTSILLENMQQSTAAPTENSTFPQLDRALLGKSIFIVFWLNILTLVPNFLTNERFGAEASSPIHLFGILLGAAILLLNGLIWVKLSSQNPHFLPAGIGTIAAGVLMIPAGLLGAETGWYLLFSVVNLVVILYAYYHEMTACSEILTGVDAVLSANWIKLWKANIVCMIAAFLAPLLTLVFVLLGLTGLLVISIASLVVAIMRLVYFYRTAMYFRK